MSIANGKLIRPGSSAPINCSPLFLYAQPSSSRPMGKKIILRKEEKRLINWEPWLCRRCPVFRLIKHNGFHSKNRLLNYPQLFRCYIILNVMKEKPPSLAGLVTLSWTCISMTRQKICFTADREFSSWSFCKPSKLSCHPLDGRRTFSFSWNAAFIFIVNLLPCTARLNIS